MYRKTMAFGRKGIGDGRHQRGGHRAVGPARQSRPSSRSIGCSAGAPSRRSRSTPAGFTARRSTNSRPRPRSTRSEGYKAMKLRFGWGPIDGAEGMQKNVALVRTVRETVGDGIDIMADAYMGWTLDYAKRMLPLLEPFNLRWLEEPVIPDDIHGYAELKALGRIPDRRRRARAHAVRVPRAARGARGGLHPVRHQPRRRPHAGAQDRRARRGAFRSRSFRTRARCTITMS